MINYKLLKAKLTDNVYPQQVDSRSFTTKDMQEKLKKRCGNLGPAVLAEAIQIISEQLAEGNTVSIDGLGTFSLRLGMKKANVKDFEDVRTQDLHIAGVRFKASAQLKRYVNKVEIHHQKGDAVRRKITIEERWVMLRERLLQQFEMNGNATVTPSSYRSLTGCTDYTARLELKQFEAEGLLSRLSIGRAKVYSLSPDFIIRKQQEKK